MEENKGQAKVGRFHPRRVSQEEYDRVLRTIEENSCFRFTAGDSWSGAFLIPVDEEKRPLGEVFHQSWDSLKKLAGILVKNRKE